MGKNRDEVARALGITRNRLSKIFGGNAAVSEAERERLLIEHKIENAIIKKACGYSYTEVKETDKPNGTEITTTHKEAAPDTSAAKIWLETRCPESWSSKNDKSSEEKLDEIFKEIESCMSEE